jgi:hypothetical protein
VNKTDHRIDVVMLVEAVILYISILRVESKPMQGHRITVYASKRILGVFPVLVGPHTILVGEGVVLSFEPTEITVDDWRQVGIELGLQNGRGGFGPATHDDGGNNRRDDEERAAEGGKVRGKIRTRMKTTVLYRLWDLERSLSDMLKKKEMTAPK